MINDLTEGKTYRVKNVCVFYFHEDGHMHLPCSSHGGQCTLLHIIHKTHGRQDQCPPRPQGPQESPLLAASGRLISAWFQPEVNPRTDKAPQALLSKDVKSTFKPPQGAHTGQKSPFKEQKCRAEVMWVLLGLLYHHGSHVTTTALCYGMMKLNTSQNHWTQNS